MVLPFAAWLIHINTDMLLGSFNSIVTVQMVEFGGFGCLTGERL